MKSLPAHMAYSRLETWVCPPVSMSLGQGLYVEFFWLVLLIRYRVEEEEKPFGVQIGPKLSKFSVSAMPFGGQKQGY